MTRARTVTIGLLVPAAMALALSASTSYRFAALRLGITNVDERLALCGTVEAAVIALTLHSWGAKSKSSAWLAYALVAVQSIPAFEVSGGAGGVFRIAAGPVLLALMLHKLLGLEMRFAGKQSTGLLATAGRELRERVVAWLGIGRRGADSAAIARSRAADRAVRLASGRKLGARVADRLADAIDAAQHGLDADAAAAAEAAIVARVVRRKSVAGLHGLDARHVWLPSATAPAGAPGTPAPGAPVTAPRTAPAKPRARARRSSGKPRTGRTREDQLLERAQEFNAQVIAVSGAPVSARGLARELSIGQDTARVLVKQLAGAPAAPVSGAPVEHVNGEPVLTV